MEFLFQYPVETGLYNDKDQEFIYGNLRIILFLREEYVYTPGKKIRVIADADKAFDALKSVHRSFHEFYDLFIVYAADSFRIGPLEIILRNQTGSINRMLMYHLIKIPDHKKDFLNSYNIHEIQQTVSMTLDPGDRQCVYYLSRTIQASHPYDKFINAFHALESISVKSKAYRQCNKCKSLLRCPTCNPANTCNSHSLTEVCDQCAPNFDSSSSFERFTELDLKLTLKIFGILNTDIHMEPKDLLKMRHLCAHPGKKGRINHENAISYANSISCALHYYLSKKYGAFFGSGGIYEGGTHTGFCKKAYTTSSPNDKFALDVPRMIDLDNISRTEPADLF